VGLIELRRRKTTFALVAMVVALVSFLVLMINGLALGLREGFGGAVSQLDADAIAFDDDGRLSLFRSDLNEDTAQRIESLPGVEASARLGYLASDYRDASGETRSGVFFGFDPGTIGEPALTGGRALAPDEARGVVVDDAFLRRAGFAIGDTFTVSYLPRDFEFTIVGTVDGGTFEFAPVVYMLRETWRELRYGSVEPTVRPVATIVLLDGADLAGTRGPGFEVVTREKAFMSVEGLAQMDSILWALRLFGYGIGAAVIGVFFYVMTLQKVPQVGLLKALGVSTGALLEQTLLQAIVIAVIGLGVALPAAILVNAAIANASDQIPINFTTATYFSTVVSLLLTIVLGVAFSLRSLIRVDPIIALARQQ
jgi:putative ABC transport system permease protein